jgi:glutaminyl-tRNA synthetase
LGTRQMLLAKELWIEREDFMVTPSKGYFRLYPGNRVRLRYGYVVECTGFDQDAEGRVIAVHCQYFPDSRSGSPGADQYKVKGNVHWVAVEAAQASEVRLYDRLFKVPNPGAGERDFLLDINPDAKRIVQAQLEPALQQARAGEHFQFERHGYFVADEVDSLPGAPVFNRAVTLRDSWAKASRNG